MLRGAIVPHAPVLVAGVAGRREPDVEPFRSAVAGLGTEMGAEDTVILLSPHGEVPCVYRRIDGSLAPSGISGAGVSASVDDELALDIAERARLPLLDGPSDHGIVVPLLMGVAGAGRVVAVSLPSPAGELIEVLQTLPPRAAVVVSAHLGAGLDPASPLTLIPDAVDLEAIVVEKVKSDSGVLRDGASDLATTGGSCSGAVLEVFGTLFAGRPLQIRRYGHPFGVGYLVGSAS